jgi:hypothetical protein
VADGLVHEGEDNSGNGFADNSANHRGSSGYNLTRKLRCRFAAEASTVNSVLNHQLFCSDIRELEAGSTSIGSLASRTASRSYIPI